MNELIGAVGLAIMAFTGLTCMIIVDARLIK